MSYQVLARKCRPQVFDELIGQPHISQTLLNALRNDRVPHAFLFTGPRGTGKTSTARILAKSLRCPNAQNFIPCGVCDSCMEIAQSRSVDVLEIDGASNNGVDSIRELRDSVVFMPSSGKYKIYIIDEVHMLSSSAFNALLKTLEEPPPHVIFMMATTEVHKIPQTILSRCQRFDFRRIQAKTIATYLKKICETEKVEATDDALWLVARQADGSMRDSLSLLDHVISFSEGHLTAESVVRILGLTDRVLLQDILLDIVRRNSQGMLTVIERLNQTGVEPEILMEELLGMIRNALFVKISPDKLGQLLDVPDDELQFYNDLGTQALESDFQFIFDMAIKAQQDITRSSDPRMVLEVVLLRMVSAPQMMDIRSFFAKGNLPSSAEASQTSTAPSSPARTVPSVTKTNAVAQTTQTAPIVRATSSVPIAVAKLPAEAVKMEASDSPSLSAQVVVAQQSRAIESKADKWLELVDRIRSEDALFAAKIENIHFLKEEEKVLSLQIPAHLGFLQTQLSEPLTKKKMQSFIDLTWGSGYSFQVIASKSDQKDSAQSLMQKKKLLETEQLKVEIAEHPRVQSAQQIFNTRVKSVTDLTQRKGN